MRPYLMPGLLCLLLPAAACGGADLAGGPATQASSQPSVIKVAPLPWEADGNGQYLLVPSPQAQIDIGQRECAATSFGMLVREQLPIGAASRPTAPGPWKIVPELYTKNLQPMQVRDGLLWVVEGKRYGQADAAKRVRDEIEH
jgi:hypothetical protein